MPVKYIEIADGEAFPQRLAEHVMAGEVFLVRRCLQRLGLFDEIRETSLEAIRDLAGPSPARQIEREDFDAIHRFVALDKIEAIADRIYERAAKRVTDWTAKIAPDLLGIRRAYYFERMPNVRFHVPYDLVAADAALMKRFAKKGGGGKLAAHPNHRDSWVGCPDNLINVWAAVGPVEEGNGLTLFPDAFKRDIARTGPSIAFDEDPGEPLTLALEPGDAILFQGDHLHASVLNRTEATRHVISFRIVTEKPHFPERHYHHYLYSRFAKGPLAPLAEVPASLSWSYFETRLDWLARKLRLKQSPPPRKSSDHEVTVQPPLGGERSFALSAMGEDSLRAITDEVCVARIGKDRLVAFDRQCPHGGGDLALGRVIDGEITCPWHNLRFDPKSGASACQTLKKVRLYPVKIEGDKVTVTLEGGTPSGA